MLNTIKYLNDNEINWFPVSIKDKKPNFGDTYKNIFVKKLTEDADCLEELENRMEEKTDSSYIKICADTNYMLSNEILCSKSQQIFTDEKLYMKGFIISIDTSDIIQLDIDIDTDDDLKKLSKNGRSQYNELKKEYPYYKSLSKKNGLHIFLIDKNDKKLTSKLKNCFNSKIVISDYNKWKNNEEGESINKDYGYIEVMCGRPLWCGEDLQNVKKKIGGAKAISVLNNIFKPTFIENNKKKTKKEMDAFVSLNTIEPPSPVRNNLNKNIDNTNFDEICEYLNNIKPSNFDSNSTFLKIVYCLCKDKEDRYKKVLFDIGKNSSKSKDNYEEWFDKLYRDGKIKSTFKTPYTIITLSKDSNLYKHYEIYNKYNSKEHISQFLPEELACIFYENNEDNFKVVKSEKCGEPPEVYFYNDSDFTWSNEEKNKFRIIKRNIYLDITEYLKNKKQSLEKKLETCEESDSFIIEKKLEKVQSTINSLGKTELRTAICECLIQKINTENQEECDFDSNGLILPFKNCIYDFKQNTVRDFYKTDNILTKIPYEYRSPCEDNYIEVTNFLTSLFPCDLIFKKIDTSTPQGKFRNIYRRIKFNNFKLKKYTGEQVDKKTGELITKNKWYGFEVDIIHREDYWDVIYTLATGLVGINIPYINIFNGEGCNGKSVICDIMKNIVGINKFYAAMKGNNLCEDIEVGKPQPQWANIDMKRFVTFQEPNENKELCVATLKYITENTIEARALHSNKTTVRVVASYVLNCNAMLPVDGASNNALERRMKDMGFPHQFCNTKEEFVKGTQIKYNKNKRIKSIVFKYMGIKNILYAEHSFQEEAKFSLLKYLLGFIKGFEKKYGKPIYDCDWKYSSIVENRTREYLGSGDRITEFMNTNLVADNIKSYIKLSDLYKAFTERSEFYKTAKSSIKDKYSKNKFFHLISQSKSYYSKYRASKEVKEGNGNRKNLGAVLVEFRLKTLDEVKNDNSSKLLDSENEISDSEEDIENEIIPYETDSD